MPSLALRYETEGDGPPVVFIHGLGATSNVWYSQRTVLSRYFRVIVYDRSGCGRSPGTGEDYSIEGWADELAGLLDHLEVATTVVVGHSLGSMIAQRFAGKYPGRTRALVLAGGEAVLTPDGKDILTRRAEMIRSEGLTAAVDPWLAGVFSPATRAANPALAGLLRAMFLAYDDASYAQQCLALRDGDVRGDHARITCPTMLLIGDQDPVTPLSWQQQIAGGIAGSFIRIVADTAHMTMLESPAMFNTALLEFLAGLSG
jgi:3-oxoadipate enol-lactonase